jgi:hypothetical protein
MRILTFAKRRPLIAAILALISSCLICGIAATIWGNSSAGHAYETEQSLTKTAQPSPTTRLIDTLIPTDTFQLTDTIFPTDTLTPTLQNRLSPVDLSTETPTIRAVVSTPTRAKVIKTLVPTLKPTTNAACDCSKDYNCSDFSSHKKAQACFVSCGGSKTNNWSGLDGSDHDGIVCESLP